MLVLIALEEVLHAPAVVELLVQDFQAQHLINRRLATGYLADPFIPQALQAGLLVAVDVTPEAFIPTRLSKALKVFILVTEPIQRWR